MREVALASWWGQWEAVIVILECTPNLELEVFEGCVPSPRARLDRRGYEVLRDTQAPR